MKSISIQVAKSSDYDSILDFIRQHYYQEEPITISHPEKGHTADDEKFTMSHIGHNSTLMAIDNETNKIVGVLIAGPIEHGDAEEMLRDAEKSSKKWGDIQKLLAYIEMKANVLDKFNLNRALHCHALSAHQDYRGNGIGQRLFEEWFIIAQKLNYKLVSTDCTSIFTAKIAERCGMMCVSTVTYDEYNESIGKQLFVPKAPNFDIKTFVKGIK